MTIDELRTEMQGEFKNVRTEMQAEFKDVRTEMRDEFINVRTEMRDEFKSVRTEMQNGFKDVRAEMQNEFKDVRAEMRDGFKRVDEEFTKVRAEIKADGETTRRHFDIMVEKVNESVKIVADGTAHNTSRLDNHETRLTQLEKPRRTRPI